MNEIQTYYIRHVVTLHELRHFTVIHKSPPVACVSIECLLQNLARHIRSSGDFLLTVFQILFSDILLSWLTVFCILY